ncbi:MAG: nuclear transport factor 2 family protein [Gemmatimonadota bacterium]|nr:MAG: nuclear transport factor 2 family protein [Gemmatimonadota bacterium]
MRAPCIFGLFMAFSAAACGPTDEGESLDRAGLRASVDSLLTASEQAWNAGDLDGFLFWYERGPETSFMGSTGLLHGWEEIRGRYAPLFEWGAARDSLRFEELETRPLAPWLGLATARYVLFQGDSVTSSGVFTLVVERTVEGWRIIHDHSSADPS